MAACRHRMEDYSCAHTSKPCYGFKLNPKTREREFDVWQERRCAYYEDSHSRSQPPARVEAPKDAGGKVLIRIFGANTPYVVDEDYSDQLMSLDTEVEILQGLLKRRYGDVVLVKGIDVNSRRLEDFPEVKEIVNRTQEVVVTINNEVKFIGSVPLPHIKRELKKLGVRELDMQDK